MSKIDRILVNLERKADAIGFPIDENPVYVTLCAYITRIEFGESEYDSQRVWEEIRLIADEMSWLRE